MNKLSLMMSITILFTVIILGLPLLYSYFKSPVSRINTESNYISLSKNSFVVVSLGIELSEGSLFRYIGSDGKFKISRAVGFSGDEIKFEKGSLFVNNKEYKKTPKVLITEKTIIVPDGFVFRFIDYVSDEEQAVKFPSLDYLMISDDRMRGTVIHIVKSNEYTIGSLYGIIVIIMYWKFNGFIKKNKGKIYVEIYYPARVIMSLNLALWGILCLSFIILGVGVEIFEVFYYIFISWLTYLGASISESNILVLLLTLFGLITGLTDVILTVTKLQKN